MIVVGDLLQVLSHFAFFIWRNIEGCFHFPVHPGNSDLRGVEVDLIWPHFWRKVSLYMIFFRIFAGYIDFIAHSSLQLLPSPLPIFFFQFVSFLVFPSHQTLSFSSSFSRIEIYRNIPATFWIAVIELLARLLIH